MLLFNRPSSYLGTNNSKNICQHGRAEKSRSFQPFIAGLSLLYRPLSGPVEQLMDQTGNFGSPAPLLRNKRPYILCSLCSDSYIIYPKPGYRLWSKLENLFFNSHNCYLRICLTVSYLNSFYCPELSTKERTNSQ